MARLSEFYQLSSVLTGLSNAKLRELDSNLEYYRLLTDNIQSDVLESMFDNYVTLRKQLTKDHCTVIKKHFITSAKFGPIACNIIKLWKTKQWQALPQQWQQLYAPTLSDNQGSNRPAASLMTSWSAA